jgi:hypothetical protein
LVDKETAGNSQSPQRDRNGNFCRREWTPIAKKDIPTWQDGASEEDVAKHRDDMKKAVACKRGQEHRIEYNANYRVIVKEWTKPFVYCSGCALLWEL